jgi:hypothetical protein
LRSQNPNAGFNFPKVSFFRKTDLEYFEKTTDLIVFLRKRRLTRHLYRLSSIAKISLIWWKQFRFLFWFSANMQNLLIQDEALIALNILSEYLIILAG